MVIPVPPMPPSELDIVDSGRVTAPAGGGNEGKTKEDSN